MSRVSGKHRNWPICRRDIMLERARHNYSWSLALTESESSYKTENSDNSFYNRQNLWHNLLHQIMCAVSVAAQEQFKWSVYSLSRDHSYWTVELWRPMADAVLYSVSQPPSCGFLKFFSQTVGNF